MKLYFAPGACSLAVHIALREVGANFDAVAVDLAKSVMSDGSNHRSISPRGYVPLLQLDDGSRHTGSIARTDGPLCGTRGLDQRESEPVVGHHDAGGAHG
jgi:hypothetical protein